MNRRSRNWRRVALVVGLAAAVVAVGVVARHRTQPSAHSCSPEEYRQSAYHTATVARGFLSWMDNATERLAPERSTDLVTEARTTHEAPLRAARAALDACLPPVEMTALATQLTGGFSHVEQSYEEFVAAADAAPLQRIGNILAALHDAARAQEIFYTVQQELPAFAGYWQLPDTALKEPAQPPSGTGLIHVDAEGHHGGFSLFVPESYTPDHGWPLIVALHGANGNGRDFIWMWLREAKSLGYLLVAPTAVGTTWGADDDAGMLEILSWLDRRYRIARNRVLLTGLSDGATATLLYGLAHPDMYRALAPLCGVLHPANAAMGNLARAHNVPIYLVHGALDFIFPVSTAHQARGTLIDAGALVEYRELPELSHTYPRSENVRILRWFEALPPR